MQKARNTDPRHIGPVVLILLSALMASSWAAPPTGAAQLPTVAMGSPASPPAVGSQGDFSKAQSPMLLDVVETAKLSKLKEQSKALSDAYRPVPGSEVAPQKPPSGRVSDVVAPAFVPAAPLLRAIYGVNQTVEAELFFDGQSYSVFSDDERIEIGPWTHVRVLQDTVILIRSPLTANQTGLLAQLSEQGLERRISCLRLGLKKANCLVLVANKASIGVPPVPAVNASRGSNASALIPPLPLPR